MRYAIKLGIAYVVLIGVGCIAKEQSEHKLVELKLNRSVESIEGHTWLQLDDGRLSSASAIESPCDVKIHFVKGKTFEIRTTSIFLSQDEGVLNRVGLTPLDKAVDFQSGVDWIEDFIKMMKTQYTIADDAQSEAKLDMWKKTPSMFAVSTRLVDKECDFSLFIVLEPVARSEVHTEKNPPKKWYISLSFSPLSSEDKE